MANNDIINWSKFDPKQIKFGAPGKNQHGGIYIPMSYPGTGKDRGFKIRTPTLTLPFGVSLFDQAGKNTTHDGPESVANYGFDMSFAGHEDQNSSVARFLAVMREFDDVLMNAAVKNSKTWLALDVDKKTTIETVRAMVKMFYRPMIKDSSHPEKNYPPVMKTKTKARSDGTCMVNFFDKDRNRDSINRIGLGTKVRFLLNVDRVWNVGNKQFGITWRPEQIQIMADPPQRDMCGFADDADDDNGGGADMDALE